MYVHATLNNIIAVSLWQIAGAVFVQQITISTVLGVLAYITGIGFSGRSRGVRSSSDEPPFFPSDQLTASNFSTPKISIR